MHNPLLNQTGTTRQFFREDRADAKSLRPAGSRYRYARELYARSDSELPRANALVSQTTYVRGLLSTVLLAPDRQV